MVRALDGMVDRLLSAVVRQRLAESPVVVLSGARAVGKSFLLRELATRADATIVDLDDLDTRDLVARDPAGPPPATSTSNASWPAASRCP